MVLVEVDRNYIEMEPMKSRETAEVIRAQKEIISKLSRRGIKPKWQMLYNEAPKLYLEAME